MNTLVPDPVMIDALLPQTQCQQCGYGGCLPYAQAIAQGEAINRCPPGGDQVIHQIALLTGRPGIALDESRGKHVPYRQVVIIDEDRCIGCTKCLPVCPVDAIVGGPKRLHHVITNRCTGCELCIAPCPVDCIRIVDVRQLRLKMDEPFDRSGARIAFERHQARASQAVDKLIDIDPLDLKQLPVDSLLAGTAQENEALQLRADASAALAKALVNARIKTKPITHLDQ